MSPAPMTFTTREGFTVALPTRDQLRPLVHAAGGGRRRSCSRRSRRAQWLTLLDVVAPGAVRRSRSRCSGTTRRSTSSRCRCSSWCAACCSALVVLAAIGIAGAVLRRRPGGADAVRPAHRATGARRAPRVAGRGVLPGARARRLARAACSEIVIAVRHHPGRQLRRRRTRACRRRWR